MFKTVSFVFLLLIASYLASQPQQHLLKKSYNLKPTIKNLNSPILAQLKTHTAAVINSSAVSAFCYINSNGTVYDLNPISSSAFDWNVTSTDGTKAYFNVCQKALNNCPNKTATATLFKGTQCSALSGNETQFSKYNILFDNVTNVTTVVAELPQGDVCSGTQNYQLTYNFVCNSSVSTPVVDLTKFNPSQCKNQINFITQYACPQFNAFALWNAIQSNNYIFGSILIVLGLIFLFFGRKFLMFTEIMTGVILAMFISLYLIFSNITVALAVWQFWTIIGVSFLIGALAGYFMSKLEWLVPMILGGFVGFIIGSLVYNTVLYLVQNNSVWIYWVTICVSIVAFAIIGILLKKHVIIIGTSIIGAYSVVRGASFMIGYFPDEKQVAILIKNSEWNQLKDLVSWQIYAYLAAFIVLLIAGLIIQYKYFSDPSDGSGSSQSQTVENNRKGDEEAILIERK